MACQGLQQIDINDCVNNVGSMKKLWLVEQEEVDGGTFSVINGEVTSLILETPGETFEPFYVYKNTSNVITDAPADLNNGSTIYTTTAIPVFRRQDLAKRNAIEIMGSGQRFLAGIWEDGNSIKWYAPNFQVSNINADSGTAKADGSKYTVTLIADNDQLPYVVSATVSNALGL